MNIEKLKYQSGFGIIGVIIAIIAVVIIVVTVLAATGVIDLPNFGSGNSSCAALQEACISSCENDPRPTCEKECMLDYQSCIATEVPPR